MKLPTPSIGARQKFERDLRERSLQDLTAAMTSAMVVLGYRLGIYEALISLAGPVTSTELASALGLHPDFVAVWLQSQADSGYIDYVPQTGVFLMSDAQRRLLTETGEGVDLIQGFSLAVSLIGGQKNHDLAFVGNEKHDRSPDKHDVLEAYQRFLASDVLSNLVSRWIPALDGIEDLLREGGNAVDLSCGTGNVVIALAQAFPSSRFFGLDADRSPISATKERIREAGVSDSVELSSGGLGNLVLREVDLVLSVNNLGFHGNPVGVAKGVFKLIRPSGSWMIIEPYVGASTDEKGNAFDQFFRVATDLVVLSVAAASRDGSALGPTADEDKVREVAADGGFSSLRLVAKTRFHVVYEARL